MRFSVLLTSAIHSLKGNARRTILTMLGIIIGIAAVITIMSLGKGFQKETISGLTNGDENKISVQFSFIPNNPDFERQQLLSFSSLDRSGIEAIEGVHSTEIDKGNEAEQFYSTTVQFKDSTSSEMLDLITTKGGAVLYGKSIQSVDVDAKKKVVVISEDLATKLYETPEEAVGKGILLDGVLFYIKGVKAASGLSEASGFNFVPIKNIEMPKSVYDLFYEKASTLKGLTVYIESGFDSTKVAEEVKEYLEKHGSMRQQGSYNFFDLSSLLKNIGKVLDGLTYFVSSIAGISLFIAGVGVMNMMYISVSERTKEIGIRRALGATKQSIQLQFLMEGIMITSIGGAIGYLLGISLAQVIASFLPFDSYVDITSILLSLGISVTIGIVFSVFPAKSAANKDVIDILR